MGPLCWWPALLVRAWDSLNGKCYGRRLRQSDQLYKALVINLCGPKQVQSADYLLRAASLSLMAPLSNVKLDLIQGSGTSTGAVRRQTLSLQSEKRLSGSGECFKFSQAGVSLPCYYPTAQTKTPELEPRAQDLAWADQRAAIHRPGWAGLA